MHCAVVSLRVSVFEVSECFSIMDKKLEERISCKDGTKELASTIAMAFLSLMAVASIVAMMSYTGLPVGNQVQYCNSQICIKETLEILNHVNVNVDPCENFYEFTCNNLPEFSTDNTDYDKSTTLMEKEPSKIEKLYIEPISNDEHVLVKTQKKLYRACLYETEIAKNTFATVQEILDKLGGWPVVDGNNWSETTFDWIEAVYKLRNLGCNSSIFLQVNIVADPKHEENYVYEISLPYLNDVSSKWFDYKEENVLMANVAVIFGVQPDAALIEMNKTYQFLQELRTKRNELEKNQHKFHKVTIEKLQHGEAAINWLKFINKIVGPYAEVYEDDFVLVPLKKHLNEWLGLIQKTPKRTLANYMMWKVVEEFLPYLTDNLDKEAIRPKLESYIQGKMETRSSFCINEIRKRFIPNSMEILYIRKYLPEAKRQTVEEIVRNMKAEFGKIINKIKWMNLEDKQDTIKRIDEIRLTIGVPKNYLNDAIFDKMIFGILYNIDEHNFLTLLLQANKNNFDWLYSLVKKSRSETKIVWKNLISNVAEYNINKNEMTIPATMVQEPTFNENRPNYLNYAHLGIALKDVFFKAFVNFPDWSNESIQAFEQKKECLIRDKTIEKTPIFDKVMNGLVANILGIKISYQAYQNWEKENLELPLAALNYTPQQLFWIVSEYTFCKNALNFSYPNLGIEVAHQYYAAVYKIVTNNLDLAHAFNCTFAFRDLKDVCKIF